MGFKMKAEVAPPQELIPPGIVEVKLTGFKPAYSKAGTSVNINPVLEVVNSPDHFGARIFENLNTGAGFVIKDFCHAFGLKEEDLGNGQISIPGEFDGDEAKPETWKYSGPLVGRTAQVELAQDEYQGKISNKIRKYICAVPGCTEKHSDDLLKKK
jgi:hypothetical protein